MVMIRVYVTVLFCLQFAFQGAGQGEMYTVYNDTKVMLISSKKKATEKEYYHKDLNGTITVFQKEVIDSIVLDGKVDFYNKCLELDVLGDIVQLPFKSVDSFYVDYHLSPIANVFHNKALYKVKDDNQIFEILSYGEYSLLKSMEVKYRKANYNVILNVGSREGKYSAKEVYYFLTPSGELNEIPSNDRKFLKLLSSIEGVSEYFEENSIDSEEDLLRLFYFIDKKT